jgi:hypothetical protein
MSNLPTSARLQNMGKCQFELYSILCCNVSFRNGDSYTTLLLDANRGNIGEEVGIAAETDGWVGYGSLTRRPDSRLGI